jgi:probable addiction module antidote protein
MSTVFVGGSRKIVRLSTEVKKRLENVVESKFTVLVGDANGADKAVQRHLVEVGYKDVTVFCSGDTCRNNLGNWRERHVPSLKREKGFQFFALKDREMARAADFGLMIWDGKSAGTVLNILRLIRYGKKAVLLNVPRMDDIKFKTFADWENFLTRCESGLRKDLQARATPDEWSPTEPPRQTSFFPESEEHLSLQEASDLERNINDALANVDPRSVVNVLGTMAKAKGMSQVAKDAGLARESLYRSLSTDGNPEFATVLRVLASVGLQLSVTSTRGRQEASPLKEAVHRS